MRKLLLALLALGFATSAQAANRFWVGGTGTWDSSTTTHWAQTSGTAGGFSVPTSADTVTFDGSSGGGTVTVNFGGPLTLQSLTTGAFTGTLDFSAHNESVTLSAAVGFNGSGAATRTINLGSGTWTISTSTGGTPWTFATTTGLTCSCASATIVFSGNPSTSFRTFAGGALTYGTLTLNATSNLTPIQFTGANTIATLNISAPNNISFTGGVTQTITNAFTWTGSSSNQIGLRSTSDSSQFTISVASGAPTMSWAAITGGAFTGGATFTATNSFSTGQNTGITITAPAGGASGGGTFFGD